MNQPALAHFQMSKKNSTDLDDALFDEVSSGAPVELEHQLLNDYAMDLKESRVERLL